MKIDQCPRYASCNAPICPLDENYMNCAHLKGEAVCLYLREYSKLPTRDNLKGSISQQHYIAVADAYPKVIKRYSYIKKVLMETSKRPSKVF